jgi:hypothetical protein
MRLPVSFWCGSPQRSSHRTSGQSGVSLRHDVAVEMMRGLVPHCFEAHCDPSAGEWDVVLEDQTATHARILAARERFHAV